MVSTIIVVATIMVSTIIFVAIIMVSTIIIVATIIDNLGISLDQVSCLERSDPHAIAWWTVQGAYLKLMKKKKTIPIPNPRQVVRFRV